MSRIAPIVDGLLGTEDADDLMIEIMDPVTTGDYSVEWRTAVGDDPTVYSGHFNFSVRGNQTYSNPFLFSKVGQLLEMTSFV